MQINYLFRNKNSIKVNTFSPLHLVCIYQSGSEVKLHFADRLQVKDLEVSVQHSCYYSQQTFLSHAANSQ